MAFNSSISEKYDRMMKLHEEISKLDQAEKNIQNNPKIENQIVYFKTQIESKNTTLQNDIKVIRQKIDNHTKKIENDINMLNTKLQQEIEELNQKKHHLITKTNFEINILKGNITDYTNNYEDKIEKISTEAQNTIKYYNENIQMRECPSKRAYQDKRADLVKQREEIQKQIDSTNPIIINNETNPTPIPTPIIEDKNDYYNIDETAITKSHYEMRIKKGVPKQLYTLNGVEYNSQAELDNAIHLEIMKHQEKERLKPKNKIVRVR
jgi:hypothetical protein